MTNYSYSFSLGELTRKMGWTSVSSYGRIIWGSKEQDSDQLYFCFGWTNFAQDIHDYFIKQPNFFYHFTGFHWSIRENTFWKAEPNRWETLIKITRLFWNALKSLAAKCESNGRNKILILDSWFKNVQNKRYAGTIMHKAKNYSVRRVICGSIGRKPDNTYLIWKKIGNKFEPITVYKITSAGKLCLRCGVQKFA